jgi:hypothetical protein
MRIALPRMIGDTSGNVTQQASEVVGTLVPTSAENRGVAGTEVPTTASDSTQSDVTFGFRVTFRPVVVFCH